MAHRFATPLVSTVRRRLDELREAFVEWPCYLEHALRPKLNAQAKIYFTDPLYARLEVGATRDTSALSEQQLGMALWRSNERDRPGSYLGFDRVLFHRTRTRREIDFVGPELGWAIESKYVDGRWRRDAQPLRASGWRGIVATRTELDLDDRDVAAIPAALNLFGDAVRDLLDPRLRGAAGRYGVRRRPRRESRLRGVHPRRP